MPNAGEATLFHVGLARWETHDKMVSKRPHKDSQGRMRFLHRSVGVTVDDPGRCPLNESAGSP